MAGARDVKAYYERPEIVARYRSEGALWPSERALVRRYFPAGSRVLEVATGGGRGALDLARMGYRVTGIDISAPLIEAAQESARRLDVDARFEVADATTLPYEDAAFDASAFLCNGVGHFPSPMMKRCLQELRRVTRAGGAVIVSYRTPYALNRLLPGLMLRVATRRGTARDDAEVSGVYVHWPSHRRMRRIFEASGLALVEVTTDRAARAGRRPRPGELYVGGQFFLVGRSRPDPRGD